jgi:N-acetylglucosamine kinase-like BadF-type ATPase
MMTQSSTEGRRPVETADPPLVMGIEANAAAVCAVVAGVDGHAAGVGRSGGASPTAYPVDMIADHLTDAIKAALGDTDPDRLRGAVLGIAGIALRPEAAAPILDLTWQRVGLHCPVRMVADPVAAFAAGTCARAGAVLIANAGSIAAWVEDGEVGTRIDGHGWLVGDDGSGFWLGRQAVRAVLAELDGRGEPTLLRPAVLGTVAGRDELPDSVAEQVAVLRSAVYDQPPIALARLAPLVPAAAQAGDRVAQRLLDRAVTLLVDAVDALFNDLPSPARGSGAPIVLAGTLLSTVGTIQREVSRRIADRYGHLPVVARSVAGGAAWLALHGVAPNPDPAIHSQLTMVAETPVGR